MRVAVIAHVFYPHLWLELAACIRNIADEKDVFITYSDDSAVGAARADFPEARFVRCENRGYDIWPFLKVLQEIDLARYGCVVKLHTKRDIDQDLAMNHTWLADSLWREYLLKFVKTRRAWQKTCRRLDCADIGMVADRHVVFPKGALERRFQATYDRAREEVEALCGKRVDEGPYVAGTMFAVRPEPLKLLLKRTYRAEMFESYGGHDRETYAHVMERMMGLCVAAVGLRIEVWSGSARRRIDHYASRTFWGKIRRFVFKRQVRNWTYSVKVLGLPVLVRRMRRIDKLIRT